MIEQWHELTLEPGPRPALVLDASESAAKLAPYLHSLVLGVLEAMPEPSRPRIFFLGNPRPYDPAEFFARGEEWFKQNAGRGSLIGPVFEALESEPDAMVAVAGAGRLFDLPDWQGHPLAQKTIWMKVGPVGLTAGAYSEETYASEQLAQILNNPSLRVEVGGPGVMPLWWDSPAFHWEDGKLVGQKTTGRLRFAVLTPAEDRISAALVMTNGTRRPLKLTLAEEPPRPEWIKLPHVEFGLLRQCLSKNRYQCPVCHGEHPAGQFRCPTNKDLTLFPTLDALPRGGFALIDTASWETRIRPHPCAVLLLAPETIAVRTGDAAKVYQYDAASDSWQPTGAFALFHALEDRRYAMVL